MTEAEWITTKMPLYMLREYPARWSERKVRLFWCACVRRVWHLVDDEQMRRLAELTQAEPERIPVSELEAAQRRLRTAHPEHPYRRGSYHPDYWALGVFLDPPPGPLLALARETAQRAVDYEGRRSGFDEQSMDWLRARDEFESAEKARQSDLIREVFGNPFRIADIATWLTSDVLALARGIYDDKAFDRMPILADALQDTGCDDVNVLDHCRDPGEHVRGCWVIDLLLGKE